jgi:acyl-CoA thioester hydrolase
MTVKRAFAIHEEIVRPEWIDYNGHMNVAYYILAFDHATDHLFDFLDLGKDYVEREKKSVFQLECHVNYLKEVKEGDTLEFTIQILDFDIKRIHFFSSMYHRDEGFLSATAEWLGIHVDLRARRPAEIPKASLKRLVELKRDHAKIPIPPQIGRNIGIRK